VAVGVCALLPSTASASESHVQYVTTHTVTTSIVHCEGVTPLDEFSPVFVTETTNTTTIQESSSPKSAVFGTVTVTAPGGRSLRYIDRYSITSVQPEVWAVTGWGVVGPGALGGDITYLEGGTANINHYGGQYLVSGHSLSVCTALGA
jgi:hypothetical protein